ncbi:DUF7933 domain-containing protein [Niabella hibiscisoli]|uniref:DUF7933 domain-containing protein n=1 Tax=Niabella hibiscisoli TaxID=1825928 RepID=UPI001F0F5432|nr:hypothetical protein [Niabella hibiscisoli]MCH5721097.1 hypothetical protein [Niabella hibiscisoli]
MAAQNNVSADGGPAINGNVNTRNPISVAHIYGPAEAWDFDADVFNATGVLPPSATPLDVRLQQTSNGSDVLVSGSYFISVDLGVALLTKSVSPASITDGGIATYTFTIDNTAPGAVNQSGISFNDLLPSGLRVAAIPNAIITGGSGV